MAIAVYASRRTFYFGWCLLFTFFDTLLLLGLLRVGLTVDVAHMLSFTAVFLPCMYLNRDAFSELILHRKLRILQYLLVFLVSVFIRSGMLSVAMFTQALPAIWLIVFVSCFSVVSANVILRALADRDDSALRRTEMELTILAGVAVVLRLVLAGALELLPEEAYYWNYAMHPAMGYLDHPPMVAWLIMLGTSLGGHNELSVRLAAIVCWLVGAMFVYLLAGRMFDRRAALAAVTLFAVLPYYLVTGLLMLPEAPLVACWAGALYFLYRALVERAGWAWLGAGVFVGLGLLSKYTIVLLGPATLLYMAVDRRSLRWLIRPHPYIAAVIALILFSPVIVWNYQNGWASFAFQSVSRYARSNSFELHVLALFALLLLTPVGLVAAAIALWPAHPDSHDDSFKSQRRFAAVFTLAPLSVFVIHSLSHTVKLNWTGPVWLAVLPVMAWHMIRPTKIDDPPALIALKRCWKPTLVTTVVLFAFALQYLSFGLPGVGYPVVVANLLGWRDLGRQIESVEDQVEIATGREPLIIGLDKNFISSELAFYDESLTDSIGEVGFSTEDGAEETAGRHLFGSSSLMYAYWFPQAEQDGKDAVLVHHNRSRLEDLKVVSRFDRLEPIHEIVVRKHGHAVGTYYYRIGYGYRARQESDAAGAKSIRP